MKIRGLMLAAGAALALGTVASAQETFNFAGPIVSNGPAGNAVNGTAMITFSNSFLWDGTISVNGTLTEVNTGTFASEARIRTITSGNGTGNSGGFTTLGNFTGSTNVVGTSAVTGLTGIPFDPFGQTWTLNFFESFDDGGVASIDAEWTNLDITFNAFIAPPVPPSIDLGTVSNGNYPAMQMGAIASGEVVWFRLDVAAGTNPLDFFTLGSLGTGGAGGSLDTEIGLYNSLGFLLASNDDVGGISGFGNFTSRIRVGGGSGVDLNGEQAGGTAGGASLTSLDAGTYYLALSTFNSTFANGFNVVGGSNSGEYKLTIVPAPGAAALAGLGVLALGRRRRA
ncbi:MAG: MYXO-CTERM sorting domain-containing protein [Phycisphaerales bacterium]